MTWGSSVGHECIAMRPIQTISGDRIDGPHVLVPHEWGPFVPSGLCVWVQLARIPITRIRPVSRRERHAAS